MNTTSIDSSTDMAALESLFASATPPRTGSTEWYDACDLFATSLKVRLRERMNRGFLVEVYGDEVGLIVRVRGDGYGVDPWSVDVTADAGAPLASQLESICDRVQERASATYRGERGIAE